MTGSLDPLRSRIRTRLGPRRTTISLRRLRRRPPRPSRRSAMAGAGPRCRSTGLRSLRQPDPNPRRPQTKRRRLHQHRGAVVRHTTPGMGAAITAVPTTPKAAIAPIPSAVPEEQLVLRYRRRPLPDRLKGRSTAERVPRPPQGRRLVRSNASSTPWRPATAGRAAIHSRQQNPIPALTTGRGRNAKNPPYPTWAPGRHPRSRPPRWCRNEGCRNEDGGVGSTG